VPAARRIITWLSLLGVLALAAPAVTLAGGGGSAGDQQYTDPFAHTHSSASSHKSTTTSTTTNAPAPATATPTTPATTTTPAAPSTPTTDPTATIASTTTTPPTSAKTLPYTGYDGWLAGAFGLVLAAAGLGLRRKAHD
jgi:hypothetical protein